MQQTPPGREVDDVSRDHDSTERPHDARAARREREADEAFARFVGAGHPDDLAVVFDFAAPRLLLIAARLAPRAAEDLVQQVFVEAIQGAARFEAGRPVMPWLTTILARRAARFRRRAAGDVTADDVADARTGSDPHDAATLQETTAEVAHAVRTLPAPYREVVHLRVLSGLRPVEIASALDRPLATVNSQLHRGLAQLRRRLPAGIASACMAALVGTGLERVAAQVHAAATQAAATTVPAAGATPIATTAIGALTVKKTLLTAAALLVAAATLVTLSPWGGGSGQPGDRGAAELAVTAVPADARAAPGGGDLSASSPPAREALAGIADADQIRVIGRVVDADGVGLAGVPIRSGSFDARLGLPTAPERSTTTARDGRFELIVAERAGFPALVPMRLTIAPPAAADVLGVVTLRAARDLDIGEIHTFAGARVAGSVAGLGGPFTASPDEAPAIDWRRLGEPDELATAEGFSTRTTSRAHPDATGAFATGDILPFGSYEVRVEGHDVLAPPMPITITADTGAIHLQVRPFARPTIEGIVVDATGQPLAARIAIATTGSLPGARAGTVADADGRFELLRTEREPDEQVDVVATLDGYEADRQTLQWGVANARFVLQARAITRVQVVADDTGEPLTDFGLGVTSGDEPLGGRPGLRRVEHHDGGVLLSDRLVGGTFTLQAEPARATGYAAGLRETFDLSVPRDLVLRVPRAASRTIEVVDANGDAVTGAVVQLLEVASDGDLSPGMPVVVPPAARGGPHLVERQRATSGAYGRAEVSGSPQVRHGLRIEHGGFARAVVPYVALGVAEPLRVILSEGGAVRGRVATSAGEPVSGSVYLQSPAHAGPREQLPREARVDPTDGFQSADLGVPLDGGRFTIRHVPPGDWELTLIAKRPGSMFPDIFPIAPVPALRDGESREVDATVAGSADVRGVVRIDGEPAPGTDVVFIDRDPRMPTAECTTGADGSYVATVREGGPYRIALRDRNARWLAVPDDFTVVGTVPLRLDLELRTREVTWRFVDATGAPAARIVVCTAGVLSGVRADADGRLTLRVVDGVQRVSVRPRSLVDDDAWSRFTRDTVGQPDRFERVMIELPAFDSTGVAPDAERTFRLPPAWGQR
ncbi:MAG: sigma-70 family RNA polymerase sigma factor [Planctomycetes bacterium]|nr:sigma-70 family RNA polymerase sigma factor [Planctomycetota bacterium]